MTVPKTLDFSCCPRTGSGSLNAKSATTATGIARTTKDHLQPAAPPARVAIPAMRSGLSAPADWVPKFKAALMRPLTPIGYWSARRDHCTEMVFALEIPTPSWAQNSMKAFTANPQTANMTLKARLAHAMIGGRRYRSASQPIGSAPSTRKPPAAELMKTMVPLLTCKVSLMFGASTLRPELVNWSKPDKAIRTTRVALPAVRSPSRSDISFVPTPGQQVIRKEDRFGALCVLELSTLFDIEDQGGEFTRVHCARINAVSTVCGRSSRVLCHRSAAVVG